MYQKVLLTSFECTCGRLLHPSLDTGVPQRKCAENIMSTYYCLWKNRIDVEHILPPLQCSHFLSITFASELITNPFLNVTGTLVCGTEYMQKQRGYKITRTSSNPSASNFVTMGVSVSINRSTYSAE
eukprot:m.243293 g.243293  ORF g.243293 m.243293 type:complete len:127 (-) comp19445_c0_seq3:1525-1905(-)